MNIEKFNKSAYTKDITSMCMQMNTMRNNQAKPMDISLGEMVRVKYGTGLDSFYEDLGIDFGVDTIQNIVNLPDPSVRWLVPEIFRDSLRLGLRKSPIYPNITAAEITVPQLSVTMPHWNMSDAAPAIVGIAETIPMGNISFGSKSVKINKYGKGIAIPYEMQQYVSVNVVSIFLQDFGVKLGMGIDTMAISALINGDQAGGSESAPVVGVASANTLSYKDILKVWLRLTRLGRTPNTIIGGEDAALLTLDLPEFKTPLFTGPTYKKLDMKTPVPQSTNYFIHGAIPANQQIIMDTAGCLIKLNAQPLMVENDKQVSNQTLEYYASLTTGFTTLYRDARVILDQSITFAANGFPAWMNPVPQEVVTFV